VEAVEFRRFELVVVEAEEVIHDDVASEGWECIGQVHGFLAGFKFLHSDGERVDVAVDDVDKVEDGTAREPGLLAIYSHMYLPLFEAT
jgi:hypothetical protein